MANSVDFKGTNISLGPPKGMDETQVSTMRAFNNGVCTVSCWKPTAEELAEIVASGEIYLSVFFGKTAPPVFLGSKSQVRRMVADYGAWKEK